MVRVTHWITALCFFTLLVSGVQIVISHPRFYWGETGNVRTPALFQIPIPASRAAVQTGYGYVLPDQNGWSRALHFQSAWAVVIAGVLYGVFGMRTGHFRRRLLPAAGDLAPSSLARAVANHARFRLRDGDPSAYNVLQRLAYLGVIFVLFPFLIWTGLAMSPGFTAAFPATVTTLGGQQSARTLHFFTSLAVVAFAGIHVAMVAITGFQDRMRAMITGRASTQEEHP